LPDGIGSGTVLPACKLTVDQKTKQIEIETYQNPWNLRLSKNIDKSGSLADQNQAYCHAAVSVLKFDPVLAVVPAL